jgi:hypothetical protein
MIPLDPQVEETLPETAQIVRAFLRNRKKNEKGADELGGKNGTTQSKS